MTYKGFSLFDYFPDKLQSQNAETQVEDAQNESNENMLHCQRWVKIYNKILQFKD